jgi:hypothetical protein
MGKKIIVKIWPEFFLPVICGEVTTQIRKDDRDYQKGDTLVLVEYDPKRDQYTGHVARVEITDVFRNFVGLMPDYCALSIKIGPSAATFKRELVHVKAAEFKEEMVA